MEWIKVTDRLPEIEEEVLIFWSDYIDIGFRTSYGSWVNQEWTPRSVTHWMPLPEKPKG